MPGIRVLSEPELNRAVLARQLLLERAPERLSLARALDRVGGIQAQYAPSMYIGLWTRLEGFEREALTRALERRKVVQGTLLRSTIHLVSPREYWMMALATRPARRAHWLRTRRGAVTEAAMVDAAARVRAALATAATLRRTDMVDLIGRERVEGVGLWVDLVRAPPCGTWERRRADVFALAEDWLGPPPADLTADDAAGALVRRRLSAFGPADANDIAAWSGLPPAAVRDVLARLELRRLRGPDGAALVDLPRAPLPPGDAPAPVRLLPTFDATLLAHVRRAAILAEEHRPRVFHTKMPQSVGTFLVDGRVAGTWWLDGGRVVTESFARLDAAAARAVRAEAERLTTLHA